MSCDSKVMWFQLMKLELDKKLLRRWKLDQNLGQLESIICF